MVVNHLPPQPAPSFANDARILDRRRSTEHILEQGIQSRLWFDAMPSASSEVLKRVMSSSLDSFYISHFVSLIRNRSALLIHNRSYMMNHTISFK